MKKIILLCLILLNGYTNIDLSNNNIIHQQIFDQIDIDTYQNIMIVAHPDDETIWGGGHLLKDKYLVICLTNGNNKTREKEFNEVMNKTHNQGIILDYPDKTNPAETGCYDVKNIYDLAGNIYDWTLEAYDTSYRVLRRRPLQLYE